METQDKVAWFIAYREEHIRTGTVYYQNTLTRDKPLDWLEDMNNYLRERAHDSSDPITVAILWWTGMWLSDDDFHRYKKAMNEE